MRSCDSETSQFLRLVDVIRHCVDRFQFSWGPQLTPPWRKSKTSPTSAHDHSFAGLAWTFMETERYADSDTRTVTRCSLPGRVWYQHHITFLGSSLRLLFPNRKAPLMCALRGVAVNLGTKALRRTTCHSAVVITSLLLTYLKRSFPGNIRNKQTNSHEFRHVLCVDSNGSSHQAKSNARGVSFFIVCRV